MSRVSDNRSKWDSILRALNTLERNHVAVGVLKDDAAKKKRLWDNSTSKTVTVYQVALAHEYGTREIPQRSFLTLTAVKNRKDMNTFIGQTYWSVVKGEFTAMTALNRIGNKFRNFVIKTFRTEGYGGWEPLQPGTLAARKGGGKSGKILRDTGQLWQSIHYEVRHGTQ